MKKRNQAEQDADRELSVAPQPGRELGAFMTVEDVAEMLRINKSTVYRMAKAGRIPATRVGRQWRFRLSALEDFLDGGGDLAFEDRNDAQEQPRKAVNHW